MVDGPDAGSSPIPRSSPALALRHNRNFRLLWIGQLLSGLGSQFGTLAYPLLVLYLTRSPLTAGVVGTVTALAAFIVRLPSGALADRLDRRMTMIACDGIRAVVLLALAVLVEIHEIVWPIVLVAAIIDRVGDTIFSPASTAALPSVVADIQLEDAWAATEARQYAASLGGPALGGFLFSLGRAMPFFGDTLSYAVSVVTSVRMKGQFRSPPTSEVRHGLWRQSFQGLRLIGNDALLRAVIIQAPLINFAYTGVLFTVTLALQHDGRSATVIGLTQSAVMVGGLLGAITAPRLQGRFRPSQLVVLITGGGAVLFAVAALLLPSPLVALPLAFPFFIAPTVNAALFASMLRETPEAMRGRVTNALVQVSTALAALSPLVAGLLVAHASSHWAMGAFAAALGVSSVLALSLKGLRQAEVARLAR